MIDIITIIAGSIFDMFLILIYYSRLFSGLKKNVSNAVFYSGFVLMEIVLNVFFIVISNFMDESMMLVRTITVISFSLFTLYLLTLYYSVHIGHRLFIVFSLQFYFLISEMIVTDGMDSFLSLADTDYTESDYMYNFMSKIVCFFFVLVTILILRRKNTDYTIRYGLLILSTPVISCIVIFSLFYSDYNNPAFYTIRFISFIGILFFNISNFFLLDNIIKSKELKFREQTLTRQLKYQSEKYDMINVAYRDTRRLIHDTKKHYYYIRSAVENKEYGTISEYINRQLDELDNRRILVNSGNLAIDSLVSNYIQVAEHDGIPFDTKIRITPDLIHVDNYDLCVIIGNLLENSINASRKIPSMADRHILFEAYNSDSELVLHISNTITPDNARDNKKSSYISYSDSLHHGYGIENVENTVDKYDGGVFSYYIEDGMYNSIVVIPQLK